MIAIANPSNLITFCFLSRFFNFAKLLAVVVFCIKILQDTWRGVEWPYVPVLAWQSCFCTLCSPSGLTQDQTYKCPPLFYFSYALKRRGAQSFWGEVLLYFFELERPTQSVLHQIWSNFRPEMSVLVKFNEVFCSAYLPLTIKLNLYSKSRDQQSRAARSFWTYFQQPCFRARA